MKTALIRRFSLTHGWIKTILSSTFFIWILLTLLGAMNDSNFYPWGLTSAVLKLGVILLIILLLIKRLHIASWFYQHKRILLTLFICLGVYWQIQMVLSLSASIGWDVGTIVDSLSNSKLANAYLSRNPNNTFLFFFQHTILNVLHLKPTWITVNFISLVCLDLSLVLNAVTARLFNKHALLVILVFQLILMIFFIQIIVPYSDVMVLPFVSLFLLGFVLSFHTKHIYLGTLLFTFGTLGAYLMKPSAVIPAIIIFSYTVIKFIGTFNVRQLTKQTIKTPLIIICLFLTIFVGGDLVFNHFEYHNTTVTITKGQGQPANHFIAMGITGQGMWSAEQFTATNNMATKQQRANYSNRIILSQLKQYGVFGFGQFLLNKNYNNTSDGTFGWFRGDGPYITKPAVNKLQQIYYSTGRHYHDYQFSYQTLWSFSLLLLLLGTFHISEFTQLLRLSILGGLAFLLIFEGGRSRYLIQFLPLILILNALTFHSTVNLIRTSLQLLQSHIPAFAHLLKPQAD
ncbi:hypothetical protein [Lactiplantibacillus herbarum]|uniref:hypothetical protein n=1 Tax=Lactiplantibacillus herbarum TaxID=1670446 RepID=UPI00064F8265|nr:hypothetical protein [Lactiplantibacillus herbarum]